jgi:hypothetical protein
MKFLKYLLIIVISLILFISAGAQPKASREAASAQAQSKVMGGGTSRLVILSMCVKSAGR